MSGSHKRIIDLFSTEVAAHVESTTPAFIVRAEEAIVEGRKCLEEWPDMTETELAYAMIATTDSAVADLIFQRHLMETTHATLTYWVRQVDTYVDGWSTKLAILGTSFANAHYRHLVTTGTTMLEDTSDLLVRSKAGEMTAAGGVILCAEVLACTRVVLERSLPKSIVRDIFEMAGVEGFGKQLAAPAEELIPFSGLITGY
jgi:hypothetical protein